jgi:hypothetical protein
MFSHLTQCDEEYGRRVAEGLSLQTGKKSTPKLPGRFNRDGGEVPTARLVAHI